MFPPPVVVEFSLLESAGCEFTVDYVVKWSEVKFLCLHFDALGTPVSNGAVEGKVETIAFLVEEKESKF